MPPGVTPGPGYDGRVPCPLLRNATTNANAFLGGDWRVRFSGLGRASVIGVIQVEASGASARKRLVRTPDVGVDVAPISSSQLCKALTNVAPWKILNISFYNQFSSLIYTLWPFYILHVICHLPLDIWHLTFEIWHLTSHDMTDSKWLDFEIIQVIEKRSDLLTLLLWTI